LAKAGGAINGVKTAVGRVVSSAVVGGTISKITGGKFANGAFGAAFARALGEARSNTHNSTGESPEPRSLDDKEQALFDSEFAKLKKKLNGKIFDDNDHAAKWMHDNVHPLAEKFDIEIGAAFRETFTLDQGKFVLQAEITTQYYRNMVDINIGGNVSATWHSHGSLSSGFSPGDLAHINGTKGSKQYQMIYMSGGYIGGGVARNSLLYQSRGMSAATKLCSNTCLE